jgi:tRNA nucleotidyltransferase/poly(A) polymerase
MPDYMFLLDSRLAPEQRTALAQVQASAHAHGINIYLAGGAVRDLITGMPIRDLDFIVEGSPMRIAHDMEKHGARILEADEDTRHVELLFAGNADGSISGARDEVYDYPGTEPHIRWSTAVDDMKRRDFSINAIAISLNPASRGLLLDPTNGLSDIEQNREVRVLSIHSFTNRPVRLLRAIRYSVRLGFKLESRTAEWFALALERGLLDKIPSEHAGREVRQVTREEKPIAVLQAWEKQGLISAIHPQLARRHPDYKGLTALEKARELLLSAGMRIPSSESFAPYVRYILGRLKSGDQTRAINRLAFRKDEVHALHHLDAEADKIVKVLKGPARKLLPAGKGALKGKVAEARATYDYLESVPRGLLAYILAEYAQPTAISKIRTYLTKWKPLRFSLPAGELEAIGMARGPQFDKVLEDLFNLQLVGRGRNLQDRSKLLRKLAGIKPEAKKKEEKKEEKKGKGRLAPETAATVPAAAKAAGGKAARPTPGAAQAKAASKKPATEITPKGAPAEVAPRKSAPAKQPAPAKKPLPARKRKPRSTPKKQSRKR